MEEKMKTSDMDTALRSAGAAFVMECDRRGIKVRNFNIDYLVPSQTNENPKRQICVTFNYELR